MEALNTSLTIALKALTINKIKAIIFYCHVSPVQRMKQVEVNKPKILKEPQTIYFFFLKGGNQQNKI